VKDFTIHTKEKSEGDYMLKDFVWNTFEYTGNIESYIFFKELEQTKKPTEDRRMAEEEAAFSNA
jgi:hypothetical protein